jgi:hypothetical protein
MFEKLFPRLPAEVRARLQSLRCWRFGDHRAYCLYEFSPTAPNNKENGSGAAVQKRNTDGERP